jgi:hypothetical protein
MVYLIENFKRVRNGESLIMLKLERAETREYSRHPIQFRSEMLAAMGRVNFIRYGQNQLDNFTPLTWVNVGVNNIYIYTRCVPARCSAFPFFYLDIEKYHMIICTSF